MSVRSGFFNSQNHDRMYNATDFNEIFATVKSDGIEQEGDKLEVVAGEGLSVVVGSGQCFFNTHWLINDSAYGVELSPASPIAPRIDAIVVEVNETNREVTIKSVTGQPSATPVKPDLVNSGTVHQHALAYVDVDTGAVDVGTIEDARTEWSSIIATYDNTLSETSENAVQNKVITSEISQIEEDITQIQGDITKTNNTSTTSSIPRNTNIPTMNTLSYALNRTTGIGSADTNYGTSMMRGISAGTSDLTAGSSALTSGAIYLVYQ